MLSRYNNSKNNKSLGVYDVDNFNKRKIVFGNEPLISMGDSVEILNNNERLSLKKNKTASEYTDDAYYLDPSDLFS